MRSTIEWLQDSTPSAGEPEPGAAMAPAGSRASLWLKLGASAVLAVAIVAALAPYLQAVPDDTSISPMVLVAYVATLLPYHLLRAGRWLFLLAPLTAHGERLSLSVVTRVSLAGYMWIALLPFRLGEFARPLFIAQRSQIGASRALGTIAIERVVDGLTVCALFFIGVAGAAQAPELDGLFVVTLGVMSVFALALVVLLVAGLRPAWVGRAAALGLGWISSGLAARVESIVTSMAEGLRALPSPSATARFVAATAAYWLTNAAGMWILLRGCGLDLDFQQSIAVLAVMNIALLVPGGPAQLGVFQTGVALGLALFVDADVVLAAGSKFAFYLYLCQLGTIVLLGVGAQRSLGLQWRTLLARPSAARHTEHSIPTPE